MWNKCTSVVTNTRTRDSKNEIKLRDTREGKKKRENVEVSKAGTKKK